MFYEDYLALKAQKRSLEKAFKEKRISEQVYFSQKEELDRKIKDFEEEEKIKNIGFQGAKISNGHFIIELNCPCGCSGTVTHGKLDFKLLGKDKKGFLYFECPKCKKHLQYDNVTGKVKAQSGILGFLFGRFK
ncbi:MAG: hypothetical protein AB1472_05705 [Candidatus Omnitrophota bacterium]